MLTRFCSAGSPTPIRHVRGDPPTLASHGALPAARVDQPALAVIVVPDYLPSLGGTTTQSRLHARELARRGWDVTVLTRRVRWGASRATIDGIAVRRIGPPGRGRVAKALDVLCTWGWLARRRRAVSAVSVIMDADLAMSAWAAGLGTSTMVTWVTMGDPARQLTGRKGAIRRAALRHCAHIALTPAMAAELSHLSMEVDDVITVPVDPWRFRPPTIEERGAARVALGVSGDVVVFIGHLQPRKAVDRLLVALKLLRNGGRDVSLVIVGAPVEREDVKYAERLARFAKTSSLSDAVHFVGEQCDVRPFLFAADLLCLPSEREGMPNVLLEAMACGIPCVAPATAGADALFERGDGNIPPSNDPRDLAAAMAALLDDPGARERARQRGLDRVQERHRIEAIIDRYERLMGVQGQPATRSKPWIRGVTEAERRDRSVFEYE